jgi:hypothetical protein
LEQEIAERNAEEVAKLALETLKQETKKKTGNGML